MAITRGRPKLPEGQKGEQINLRIPSPAYKYLREEAEKNGLTPATFAKNILMTALANRIFGG